MEYIIDIINNNQIFIIFGLIVVIVILFFIIIMNKVEINRLEKRYKKLMKGSSGKNIEDMIIEYNQKVEDALEVSKNIEEIYKNVDERLKKCIQRVGIVRYRAFDDVGSDLSFSIALLDENNAGVVVTGIYGRNECTTFAKPIENGISKYDLSEEEKLAIKNAINV
ncbi:hypothetical protein Q428_06740 [Fervidicella metallireducens AeB]|uniref:DUF4446 domain-containing protein n=1 Tax=Fervidicella metallireducens AeB TaxID=1403537 RepID=A0A017RVN3_9CLOT|nr:DUF4446 family protein [Fervidicella metallireducens]EYE88651.1 hypothetical protein Q428_06740 [Fervidicella metallireducens AeB]